MRGGQRHQLRLGGHDTYVGRRIRDGFELVHQSDSVTREEWNAARVTAGHRMAYDRGAALFPEQLEPTDDELELRRWREEARAAREVTALRCEAKAASARPTTNHFAKKSFEAALPKPKRAAERQQWWYKWDLLVCPVCGKEAVDKHRCRCESCGASVTMTWRGRRLLRIEVP